MVNNIKNDKISEIFAKKDLNTLNELKNAEITKQKKRTPRQKELLNFFNDLSDTISTDETLQSKRKEEENKNENENENRNENDKTLIPSKDEKEQENENENKNKNDNKNENDKTLIPSKDEKGQENENEKEKENEKKNEDKNEDENKNMLLEYIEDVDDKLFKKYSDVKILIVLYTNLIMQQMKKIKKR